MDNINKLADHFKKEDKEEIKIIEFNCPICKCKEAIDVDYLRLKKEDFVICKQCGFVTYNITEETLDDFYRSSDNNPTRKFSGSIDDMTKDNKLPYHRKFIGDLLTKKKGMKILDIGCSTGYVLKMCRDEYNQGDVYGIELNPGHAEYGRQAFNIPIDEIGNLEELPKESKYDLIINFAVLEHMFDPVKQLKLMRERLEDDGYIYIMTPIWFKTIYNSQFQIAPFEALFIKEHLNCFSETSRQNCFDLAGFKVTKHDNAMYGDMVLLQKCKPKKDIKFEDAKKVQSLLSKTKEAIEIFSKHKFEDSLKVFPNNPEAYIAMAMVNHKDDYEKQEEMFKKGLEIMPNYFALYQQMGVSLMQQNKFKEALKQFEKALECSPACYQSQYCIAEIHNIMGDYEKSNEVLKALWERNPNIRHKNFVQDGYTVRDLFGVNCYKISKKKGAK